MTTTHYLEFLIRFGSSADFIKRRLRRFCIGIWAQVDLFVVFKLVYLSVIVVVGGWWCCTIP